jgi:hypothetical protein
MTTQPSITKQHGRRPAEFLKGQRVRYIPNHALLNQYHPDCRDGVVSSKNEFHVFVKYDNLAHGKMTTGDEPYTAAATNPENLIHL